MQLNLQAAFLMLCSAVANIALVKADKARKIEDLLIMNAQARCITIWDYHTYRVKRGLSMNSFTGVIQGKVDETQLKAMLEQINEKTEQKTKVLPSALHTSHFSTCYSRRLLLLAA